MTVTSFLELLRRYPDAGITIRLPDGNDVPAHFHITEVGHLVKSFIDCGGKRHHAGSCLLQVWVADDTDHRLTAGKLLGIFERTDGLLPSNELPVEIEHEAPVLTQMPVTGCDATPEELVFHTEFKKADCLAKELCIPDFSLPGLPGQSCTPGSGCC
ncbi:conserved hypothetical protein [Haloferula helveola]|uniref:DUF4160 domain-containing protein n=1 Tax=Haloferula helveola TaxID=490095 RepID=A0ABM7RGI8_9BACT|nr:conserved hypothetical protein [Haloferula helveola]